MKVGDYVRTKNGFIGKLKYIDTIDEGYNHYYFEKSLIEKYDRDIIKSSPNIIDLIKKEDIIIDYKGNIYQVVKVWKGYVFTNKKNKYGQVITLVDYQIKSIVTKEQFSQMEYRIGE